jgi:hypothetical protein
MTPGRCGYKPSVAKKKAKTRLIGRDAGTGRFKSVGAARRDKRGSIVQRLPLVGRRTKKK